MTQARFTPESDNDSKSFQEQVQTCSRILESPMPTDPAGIAARRKLTSLVSEDSDVMEALTPPRSDPVLTELAKYEGADNGRLKFAVLVPESSLTMARFLAGEQISQSGFRGVAHHKVTGKWTARIQDDGVRVVLGHFDTAEEAARCYDEEARRLRGPNAITNFA